ncbi:MAG: hypothetical protein MUP58_02040 [Candidatus Nanohaloarchaeota archaeon QJJ-9]|nr:hypothetical protein [Candidatus Nanohaloarchaeota archaeon QJJ-9]
MELKENSYKLISASLGLILIATVAWGLGYIGPKNSITEEKAGRLVEEALEARGAEVSIESVSTEGDLYKVFVKSEEDINSIFLTRDGKYIVQNPINASDYTQKAKAMSDFLGCLREKDLTIYGKSNLNATKTQIKILGGPNNMRGLYQELDNQTTQKLVNQGVKTIPVTVHNGKIYQGVKTAGFYKEITNCSYEFSNQTLLE